MNFKSIYLNCTYLLRYRRSFFLLASFIVSFLILLVNILWLFYYNTVVFWDLIQERLGLYFYIRDDKIWSSETSKSIEWIKYEMESKWIKVEYISKDNALSQLSNKLPNISKSLETYNIENPLPSTLYIRFSDAKQYDIIKNEILKYQELFVDSENKFHQTYSQQQFRILQVISMIKTVRLWVVLLWSMIFVIIFSFLYTGIKLVFSQFQWQLLLEEYLGLSHVYMFLPFFLVCILTLFFSYMLVLAYTFVWLSYLNKYFLVIFSQSIYEYLLPSWKILSWFHASEILLLFFWSIIIIFIAWMSFIKEKK